MGAWKIVGLLLLGTILLALQVSRTPTSHAPSPTGSWEGADLDVDPAGPDLPAGRMDSVLRRSPHQARGSFDHDGKLDLVIGSRSGVPGQIAVYRGPDLSPGWTCVPFEADFPGGIRVTALDVDGDRVDDVVAAPGPGRAAEVRIFSGVDGSLLRTISAPEDHWTGGLNVVAGSFGPGGRPLIITGVDPGGGPRISLHPLEPGARSESHFAFDFTRRHGVRVQGEDLDGDGIEELVLTENGPADPGSPVRGIVTSVADRRVLHRFETRRPSLYSCWREFTSRAPELEDPRRRGAAVRQLRLLSPIDLGDIAQNWSNWIRLGSWLSGDRWAVPRFPLESGEGELRAIGGLVFEEKIDQINHIVDILTPNTLSLALEFVYLYPAEPEGWLLLGAILEAGGDEAESRLAHSFAFDRMVGTPRSGIPAACWPGFVRHGGLDLVDWRRWASGGMDLVPLLGALERWPDRLERTLSELTQCKALGERSWATLGDYLVDHGVDGKSRARHVWNRGLKQHPASTELAGRLGEGGPGSAPGPR